MLFNVRILQGGRGKRRPLPSRAAALLLVPLLLALTSCRSGVSGSEASSRAGSSSAPSSSSSAASAASSSASTSSAAQTTGVFSLPYTNVPSFNPLAPASALNQALWPLIYDCVSEPGPDYKPVMRLAASVASSGTTATVTLKSGLLFSDGTSLTGQDVAYSYNYVKARPTSPYASRLANVASVTASGLTVTLRLSAPDPLIANLLDIPVIKEGSEAAGSAVGSGRYVYAKSGVNGLLTANAKWYGGSRRPFQSIPLVNIPDATTVMSSLAIGLVNYVYSDNGDATAPTYVSTTTSPVNLNRLVFIGINTGRASLANAHFRRALSLSIDRSGLVSQTYSGRAHAALLPFAPSFSLLPAASAKSLGSDYSAATAELSKAGGAGSATLTLLVNQENAVRVAAAKFVASCFVRAGVNVRVSAVPLAQYKAAIAARSYDLFIGETRLMADMDITPLLNGSLAPGAPQPGSALAAFGRYRAGSGTLAAAASAFDAEMPVLPLCYRTGTTSYTRGLRGVQAMDGDIFYNFENWSRS